jgi:DNA-binding transcriptional ArsR family regulator
MPPRPDVEAVAQEVFTALADPTRRAILAELATGGPATATDLAARLPITRQAIAKHLALLSDAGLVAAEHGERRRVRYRLRSAPMQVAQQFLAGSRPFRARSNPVGDRGWSVRRPFGRPGPFIRLDRAHDRFVPCSFLSAEPPQRR